MLGGYSPGLGRKGQDLFMANRTTATPHGNTFHATTPHSAAGGDSMTTATTPQTNLEWALWYAAQGTPVGPLWPLDALGACTCKLRADCDKAGKHPWNLDPDTTKPKDVRKHGTKGYTTDADQLHRWWTQRPDSGIGTDLGKAGIITIGPDSTEWAEKFERRGLNNGPRYASRADAGHWHELYRRPDDCPPHRICRSGEYDIMSNGNLVLPPTPNAAGGTRAWLTANVNLNGGLPAPPAWVVSMLKDAAAKDPGNTARPHPGPLPDMESDDEPPIVLSAHDLTIWHGTDAKRKPDGSVDRSASLFRIAGVLYDAGANGPLIMWALRDRDHALGFHKFCCGRADAERQYASIITKLKERERRPREWAASVVDDLDEPAHTPPGEAETDEAGTGRPSCGHVPELRRLRAENAQLREERSLYMGVHRNKAIKSERATALAAAFFVDSAARRGKAGDDGFVILPMAAIAEGAGTTTKTARGHLDRLNRWGVLACETRNVRVEVRDPMTGATVLRPQPRVFAKIDRPIPDYLRALAALDPDRPASWGDGRRFRGCPDHPTADVIRRVTLICAECGQIVDERETVVHPSGDLLLRQDDSIGPEPPVDQGEKKQEDRAPAAEPTLSRHDDAIGALRAECSAAVGRAWFPSVVLASGPGVGAGVEAWVEFLDSANEVELRQALAALAARGEGAN